MYALQLNLLLEILCMYHPSLSFLMIFGQSPRKPSIFFVLCMNEYCVQHEMFALEGAINEVLGFKATLF